MVKKQKDDALINALQNPVQFISLSIGYPVPIHYYSDQ